MIKKITIIILFSLLIISCGKKSCPKNNEAENVTNYLIKLNEIYQ